MATKSALPLLALGAGALFVMAKKKDSKKSSTGEALPSPMPAPEPEPEPSPGPGPEPTPPGPVPGPTPAPQPDEERGEAYGIKPGTYSNFHTNARYGLVSPYRTPKTTVSLRRKSGMVYYPAKNTEARFAGWNPQNPEELLVDIDAKGEYSIMTHDGGPQGVFIAEWVLKVTED